MSHLKLSHFLGHDQRTKAGPNSAEKGDGTKYPIETYQGLEEATAERIKRFEDETKAMLMRNSRSDLTPATPEMGRTTSGNVILMYHIFLLITRVILNKPQYNLQPIFLNEIVLGFLFRRCREWVYNVKVFNKGNVAFVFCLSYYYK